MEADTERTAVKTYVPAYQKERWREHAEALGMSQSEFVRTMVQAGRRGFDPGPDSAEGGSPDDTPGDDGFEHRVLDTLSTEGALSWDELLEALSGDFETRLEGVLDDLQAADRVRYNGRRGGYTLIDE